MLRTLLPLYRAITTVQLGDGCNTSFWHDVWSGDDSMAERFPELYTHCKDQEISVKKVQLGLSNSLVPRLSLVVTEQLTEITQILSE